jgi:hypothetical protein
MEPDLLHDAVQQSVASSTELRMVTQELRQFARQRRAELAEASRASATRAEHIQAILEERWPGRSWR